MRQRNKLYTVNKYNKPMFMPQENMFDWGGLAEADKAANPWNYADDLDTTQQYMNSKNWLGISKKNNPFSKGNLKQAFSGEGGITSGIISGVADLGGRAIGSAISGGLSSGAGTAITNLGNAVGDVLPEGPWKWGVKLGSGVLGGVTNALFGESVDEKALAEANEGTNALKSFNSNAGNFDEIKGPEAVANVQDVYKGGLFNDVSDKNEALKEQRRQAKMFADRSVTNNVNNLIGDQLSSLQRDYFAYGGPMDFGGGALGLMQQNRYFDTIDKRSEAIAGKGQTMQTGYTGGANTFEGGGLKLNFMNEFGEDPIGAVVRYNQGLEDLAAREELLRRSEEQALQNEALQQQMTDLRLTPPNFSVNITQDYGVNGIPQAPKIDVVPILPDTLNKGNGELGLYSSPSKATSNPNWDYIEDQLRRSGKFNDVQIEGIKYNLQRESAINPDAVGDSGSAFGLGQWHGKRQPKDRSLKGQTQHLIDTLSAFDGKEHWVNEKDYEGFLNARTPEEAHYFIAKGYERPKASIVAKVKRDSDMSLKKLNAFGGELGTNGTDFTNGLLYIDEGGSHESNPLDGVPMGLDPEGIPNLVEEGETVYNDYVFSDRMKVPFFMYKELGLGGIMKKKGKEMSFADASKKLAQESEKRPNDPISQAGLDASLSRLAEIQETERMRKQAKEYQGLDGYACGGKINNKYATKGKMNRGSDGEYDGVHADVPATPKWDLSTDWEATAPWLFGTVEAPASEKPLIAREQIARDKGTTVTAGGTNFAAPKVTTGGGYRKKEDEDPKTYDTWMRYAPALGAGVMTLTDALGLTNKPDYTYADKIAGYAERAGYAPKIDYNPIGNYLTYRPMDIWYEQNALNAQSRATDRALMNVSSPSRAAGLLANGYNSQLASGNLYRNALEYNDAKRERVADFNRRTNMFNSQMGLEAAMANARYHQAAQQMGLSGLAQAAALRDSIDARVGAAKSANLSNFLTSLGNIGRENFAMNQINWDRSRRHGARADGTSYDKVTGRACGGKINRRK